jgi:hypothetical protein
LTNVTLGIRTVSSWLVFRMLGGSNETDGALNARLEADRYGETRVFPCGRTCKASGIIKKNVDSWSPVPFVTFASRFAERVTTCQQGWYPAALVDREVWRNISN